MKINTLRSTIILACMAAVWSTTAGFSATSEIRRGTVTPKVNCSANPAYDYAVFLPKDYTANRTWPIVYGFSPNGAGMEAVNHLRNGAQKYGYIVVGSNNARNGPWPPINKAIKILVEDVERRFPVDPDRRYACGFSGGARMSFTMANKYKMRGIIPCSSGFGEVQACPKRTRVYAFCGTRDGNLAELQDVVRQLGWPHNKKIFLMTFPGGHGWPPEGFLDKALYWMDPKYADNYSKNNKAR